MTGAYTMPFSLGSRDAPHRIGRWAGPGCTK